MTILVLLAAALAPSLSVSMISMPEVIRIRDTWLLTVLALGAVWLAFAGEVWLALMALWYLIGWRSPARHAGLLTWVAIGATWFMLRSLPPWAWTWLPWAWLTIAAIHVARCAWLAWCMPSPYERRALFGLWRTKAWQGSPAITAIFFALVAPFCPWWGWPVLGLGLYLTWSWLAFIGVATGLAVLYPAWAGWLVASVTLVLATWAISWAYDVKLFEWTPRGDSFDSVIARLTVWVLLVQAWWAGPRWLGRGAYALDPELRRWSSRSKRELPTGESSVEPLQHLYEYGALGILAVGFLGLRLSSGFACGDPWTAALAASAVISLGHYPCRQPAIGLVVLTLAAGVIR